MKIDIPTSIADITLGEYLRLRTKKEEEHSEDVYNEHLIVALTTLTKRQVRQLTAKSRATLVNRLRSVLAEQKHSLQLTVKLGQVELGFIPNLDRITFGEFIDLDKFSKEEADWPKLMKVLYRPIAEWDRSRYRLTSYDAKSDLVDYEMMPMSVVLGALVFFCDLGTDLLIATLRSLKQEETLKNPSTTLESSGVGMEPYIGLLGATYYDLKTYRKSLCISV